MDKRALLAIGGLGGLIALLCLCGIIVNAVSPTKSPKVEGALVLMTATAPVQGPGLPTVTPKPMATERPTATPKPTEIPVPTATPVPGVGETQTIGDLAVTFDKAVRQTRLQDNVWNYQAKGVFVLVYLTLMNNGKETISLHDRDCHLMLPDETRYNAGWVMMQRYQGYEILYLYENAPPKLPAKVLVIFDVPTDATGFTFTVGQKAPISFAVPD